MIKFQVMFICFILQSVETYLIIDELVKQNIYDNKLKGIALIECETI